MTKKLFHTLAILAVALFAGQGQLLMAQSATTGSRGDWNALRGIRQVLELQLKSHASRQVPAPQSRAVELGLTKQKVYSFRTVDYPAATSSDIFDFDDGTAVGEFAFGTSSSGNFYFKGTLNHLLNVPGATDSIIEGINGSGQMVGNYVDSNGISHGFSYDGKSITSVDVPGSTFTDAVDLNDAGVIVGQYIDTNSVGHGFQYKEGTFTTIDCPGAQQTIAAGVNSSGEIVGICFDNSGTHGFLLSNGGYSTIDFPLAAATLALGINDAGSIAGTFNDNTTLHGFTYIDGVFSQVDVGGGTTATTLWRIKNNKNVVGYAKDSLGENHGIIGK